MFALAACYFFQLFWIFSGICYMPVNYRFKILLYSVLLNKIILAVGFKFCLSVSVSLLELKESCRGQVKVQEYFVWNIIAKQSTFHKVYNIFRTKCYWIII